MIEPRGEARTQRGRSSPSSPNGSASARPKTRSRRCCGSPRAWARPGAELLERGVATPPHDGAPIQFVDVFPLTPDQKVHLFPEDIAGDAPAGLYGYQPDPATERFPLALISPATEKTISSTLGELRERAAMLHIHPGRRRAARASRRATPVRVFNALGELHCPANLTADVRQGTVAFSKGRVAQEHLQRIDVERAGARTR